MTKPPQLEGTVDEDSETSALDLAAEVDRLEAEVRLLHRRLDDATHEKQVLERSVNNMRALLLPLYRGLRALFGEIELGIGDAPMANGPAPSASTQPPDDARWQSFKHSFPGVGAEIIDALLIHGEMRMTNLANLLKRNYKTVHRAATTLRGAGAITLNQGLLTLKR